MREHGEGQRLGVDRAQRHQGRGSHVRAAAAKGPQEEHCSPIEFGSTPVRRRGR